MNIFLQHPPKNAPEPPVVEHGDNHITGPDETDEDSHPPKEDAPEKPADESVEEQHDAGHGDLHPANEVWR